MHLVRRLPLQNRSPSVPAPDNPEGDLLFINGKVTRKFEENGKSLVEIAQEARQQDDELSIFGSGIVSLPRRAT